MSLPQRPAADREMARALIATLERLWAPGATRRELATARDAAQILGLDGLDRLLAACEPHAGRPWPPELRPALERLARLAAEVGVAESLEPFLVADPGLRLLATELLAVEWSDSSIGGAEPAVPTLSLAAVLDDLPLADDALERARRVRLTAPVAAALRAGLDWLLGPEPAPPLRIGSEDSALELLCDRVSDIGIGPAETVLSWVGGNLGPTASLGPESRGAGPWIVRVPTFAGRNSYLMMVQGDVRIALPWHAVLRIRMVPATAVEARLHDLDLPVLEPIAPLSRSASEYPIALIAYGLKRAYLVADRLVWKLEATATHSDLAPPAEALERAIETGEGEVFWLADPGRLLSGVAKPSLSDLGPIQLAPLPLLGPEDVEPLPVPGGMSSTPRPTEPETTREPEDPRPPIPSLGDPPPPAASAPSAAASTVAPEASAVPESLERGVTAGHGDAEIGRGTPRALVADDSITARVFLVRLLEQRGFAVRAVATARELWFELPREPWSLVCVDTELPDGRGVPFLRALADHESLRAAAVPRVALVRDAVDVTAAHTAGWNLVLRKPFDRKSLAQLLARLGLPRGADE